MTDIKTREQTKDIRILDRARVAEESRKETLVRTRGISQDYSDDGQPSPSEYAEDKLRNTVEGVISNAGQGARKQADKAI